MKNQGFDKIQKAIQKDENLLTVFLGETLDK